MRYDKDIFEAVLLVCNNEGEGREAIGILESLGAKPFSLKRHKDIPEYESYAYINKHRCIKFITCPELSTGYRFTRMTISEYQSKYPYRPGDEVRIPSVDDKITFRVTSAIWNGKVEYYIAAINKFFIAEQLYPVQKDEEKDVKVNAGHDVAVPNCPICPEFLDENEVKKDEKLKLVRINMTSENFHDEVEIILGNDFELKTEDDGRIKLVRKKNELPKTYTECCRLLGTGFNHYLEYLTNEKRKDFEYHLRNDLSKLAKLIVCRNAYWKLTGDPSDAVNCYSIIKRNGEPTVTICGNDNKGILAFLECKAAEEFVKNFSRSIKDCKLI